MESKPWMKTVMRMAAIYNFAWGGWVILFPLSFFHLTGMTEPVHPTIWQGMGMVIGVYGLGYWWSATNPVKHWPIIAVGFLGKIFGPVGFVFNYLKGDVPAAFGYTLITNDLIWWIPFFLILNEARKGKWEL